MPKTIGPGKKNLISVEFAANILLALLGVMCALGLVEVALRLNPHLVPPDIPTFPPARRFTPSQDTWLDVRRSSGDLFTRLRDNLRPLSPSEDRLLERVHLQTDRQGFRNAEPWREKYDVVALGDSFTYGTAVPSPWPERLAQVTNKSVLNLGWEGAGPLDERDLFLQYGRTRSPQWVILAYFEANDLNDVRSYMQAEPLLLPRVVRFYVRKLIAWANPGQSPSVSAVENPSPADYQYPIFIRVGEATVSVTLFDFYLSWLSASASDIRSSHNFRMLPELWRRINNEMKGSGSRLLIVFVPSKEHLFLRQIHEPEMVNRVLGKVPPIVLEPNGFLNQGNGTVDPDKLFARIDDQENVIAQAASEIGADFLDLTPCFRQGILHGSTLYYEFDTHWNQAGHELAAELIAEYLAKGKVACP